MSTVDDISVLFGETTLFSDTYMKLIERVSDLSDKLYAIEEVNYEAEL